MKKKVVAALGSLIAMNVVCLGMITFAWFTSNQKADNDMVNITAISAETIDVDFKIYAWDDENKTGIECDSFKLDQYDSFITSRNANISKIIRFEIIHKKSFTEDDSFSLTIPCEGDFTVSIGGNMYVDNNISNIIKFKSKSRNRSRQGNKQICSKK